MNKALPLFIHMQKDYIRMLNILEVIQSYVDSQKTKIIQHHVLEVSEPSNS